MENSLLPVGLALVSESLRLTGGVVILLKVFKIQNIFFFHQFKINSFVIKLNYIRIYCLNKLMLNSLKVTLLYILIIICSFTFLIKKT